ncbi:MAG: sigma-70 family RNA polymerase sigma factor [Bacilli bacterium]|nr:sigma-70 family RNA polymerase sigma factor [Candidatus Onthovivens sp.]MDY5058210.1 sigma-70 family RNA polymerase sigma factor [Bacilli bacterium]
MTNEELVLSYQQGNKNALEELIENNKGIVFKIASKFYINNNIMEKEDLEQEGFTGLIIAVEKYDINNEKKAGFITYAINWIYERIYRFVCGASTKGLGNTKLNNSCISLNTPTDEEGEMELIDYIKGVDYSYENVEEKIYNEQLHQELEQVMNETLTLQEREAIKFSYGWNNIKPMTLEEIGDIFNVSHERIRQVKKKGFRKLRLSSWAKINRQRFIEEGYIEDPNKFFKHCISSRW